MEYRASGDLVTTMNRYGYGSLLVPVFLWVPVMAVLMSSWLGSSASAKPPVEASEEAGTRSAAPRSSEVDTTTETPRGSSRTPAGDLQPVDTLRGTLSGLDGLAFGMTEEMVLSKVSVPLAEGRKEDLNPEFLGEGDLLQSANFPVMPNETKPVQFVFRKGTLYGVCVCLGKVTPQQYVQMLTMLGQHFGGKGIPAGDREAWMRESIACGEGRPHRRICTTFNNEQVVVQLSWNEDLSSSILDLVFIKQEDPVGMQFDDKMLFLRRKLGVQREDP